MKLKNLLCIAALAAVVALTGVSAGSTAAVAQAAEETRIAGLDAVLQQMYALYSAENYEEMYALDASEATKACVEMVRASGADRYILDLDGNTKAMMYADANGGYWWYFGQMQGSLRHGQGTTVIVGSDAYRAIFTGPYSNDYPSGQGKLTCVAPSKGSSYEITGDFQGLHLNGTYQATVSWLSEVPCVSSHLITYNNSMIAGVSEWEMYLYQFDDTTIEYDFYNSATENVISFGLNAGEAMYVVGLDANNVSGWGWWADDLNTGLHIFHGNADAAAVVQPSATAPIATEPTVITVPVFPTIAIAAPSTYTVVPNDYLRLIAKKVYDDENRWKEIYESNKSLINNPNLIYTGQVFAMP